MNKTKHDRQGHEFPHSVVLYDHSCQLCRHEMGQLKQRDHLDRLLMVDISSPSFDPKIWGFDLDALNRVLHVRTPAGDWLTAMPAVRHVYQQVGLGWLWWPSHLPVLSSVTNQCYAWFARNRHSWSTRIFSMKTCRDSDNECTVNQPDKGGAA